MSGFMYELYIVQCSAISVFRELEMSRESNLAIPSPM